MFNTQCLISEGSFFPGNFIRRVWVFGRGVGNLLYKVCMGRICFSMRYSKILCCMESGP